jgi:hypothetical protein
VRRFFTSVAPTVITVSAGILVLVSFILPLILPQVDLVGLRTILIDIAIIVASVALLLGFGRLLNWHWQRFRQRRSGYSLIAVLTALIVFGVLFVERVQNMDQPATSLAVNNLVFNVIILPIQSSLGALLAIFLAAAAVRMARRRRTWGTVWFLVSAVIVLITQIPPTGEAALFLQPVRDLLNALAMGGLRGLLLGVALGTMAVAFRVLFAIDRPQSE